MSVTRCKTKLPEALRHALDETGLPWTIEAGKRHFHVRIAGRPAAEHALRQQPARNP